jgi:hypothetical protein
MPAIELQCGLKKGTPNQPNYQSNARAHTHTIEKRTTIEVVHKHHHHHPSPPSAPHWIMPIGWPHSQPETTPTSPMILIHGRNMLSLRQPRLPQAATSSSPSRVHHDSSQSSTMEHKAHQTRMQIQVPKPTLCTPNIFKCVYIFLKDWCTSTLLQNS